MVTREDLTGQTFGRLTVLGPAEDYVSPIGKHYARWLCRCECGKQVTVKGNSLKSGATRSCGCLLKEPRKKRQIKETAAKTKTPPRKNTREDLTGQTFGRLTVLGPAEDYVSPIGKHYARWLCRCVCGNLTTVLSNDLKSGNTRSCGCLRKVTDPESNGRTREDLTGQTFGRLTVLGPAEDYVSPSRKRLPQWLCRCECGKQVTVKGCHLKSGATKSCGCLQKQVRHTEPTRRCADDMSAEEVN